MSHFFWSCGTDCVKELTLRAYELVPEAYRQKLRNSRKENYQTHVELARTKEQYLTDGALQRKWVPIMQNLGNSCYLKSLKGA